MIGDQIIWLYDDTYNSARHSMRTLDPGAEEIVDEVEAALSSSARTATMTAAIS